MTFVSAHPKGLVIKIHVQPKSAKTMLCGLHGDALKLKLTAPPVEGAANKMCIQFLAKWLGIPKSTVEIIAGAGSREKRILIHLDGESARKALRQRMEKEILSTAAK